eukprot:TRINITY_DN1982_c0_g1_i2.p1 TRINITY_DN1982_c0_g1~~TRINITY_DN1982_c0_g1_i2.p1  ORF type:complete len:285 (-),score=91.37 TRINITY_DN1982_c0_g1_i2:95-949(-)
MMMDDDANNSESWNGLDALLNAKPIDFAGSRDSEYFGGRVSFCMSPPKQVAPKSTKTFSEKTGFQGTRLDFDKENTPITNIQEESASNMNKFTAPKTVATMEVKPAAHVAKVVAPVSSHSVPSSTIPPSTVVKPKSKIVAPSSSVSSLPTPTSTKTSMKYPTTTTTTTPASSLPFAPTPAPTPASPEVDMPTITRSVVVSEPAPLPRTVEPVLPSRAMMTFEPAQQDDLSARVLRLEEENRYLRNAMHTGEVERQILLRRILDMEEQMRRFMKEVKMVVLPVRP